MDLKYKIVAKDSSRAQIALEGDLREGNEAVLAEVARNCDTPAVTLDVGGIDMINSLGLARWIRFVRQVTGRSAITFERVPALLLHEARMSGSVLQKARIVSAMLPFYCATCDNSVVAQIDVATVAAAKGASRVACGKCGGERTEDTAGDSYVAWLVELAGKPA